MTLRVCYQVVESPGKCTHCKYFDDKFWAMLDRRYMQPLVTILLFVGDHVANFVRLGGLEFKIYHNRFLCNNYFYAIVIRENEIDSDHHIVFENMSAA